MHDEPYEWRCPECRAMDRYWNIANGGFQCQSCGYIEAGDVGLQEAEGVAPGSGAGSDHAEGIVPAPTTHPAGVVWPVVRGRLTS